MSRAQQFADPIYSVAMACVTLVLCTALPQITKCSDAVQVTSRERIAAKLEVSTRAVTNCAVVEWAVGRANQPIERVEGCVPIEPAP